MPSLNKTKEKETTSGYTQSGQNMNHFHHQIPNQNQSQSSRNGGSGLPGYQISSTCSNNVGIYSRIIRSHNHHHSSRTSHYQISQPSLINLDRKDLSIPLFQYPLLAGVTMLGTGKGTVKAPDIVLHGSSVAPQHAFLERLGNQVILHPISQNTSLNGRPVAQPTPLKPGNLISIGDSYFFRYDGPTSGNQNQNQMNDPNHFYVHESPYAVINSSKSSTNMEEMEDSSRASSTCPNGSGSPRSSSNSTSASTSDPEASTSVYTDTETSLQSSCYRDGLETERFMNKIARFEYLSHVQAPPPFPTVNDPNYGMNGQSASANNCANSNGNGSSANLNNNYGMNGLKNGLCANESKNRVINEANGTKSNLLRNGSNGLGKLTKPNINFNRSDQGFGYYSASSDHHDSSLSCSSISPPDRIPSSISNSNSYRKPTSHGVTFYEDGIITSPSPASIFLSEDEESACGFMMNHFDRDQESVPSRSPDSLSSISNHNPMRSHNSYQNGHNCNGESSTTTRSSSCASNSSQIHVQSGQRQYSSNGSNGHETDEASIACETLLHIKRKQIQEAQSQKEDKIKLDEILAMCAEYEEQIAKEIETSKIPLSSSLVSLSTRPCSSVGSVGASSNSNGHSQSPATPNVPFIHPRIKTNGSLPRDLSKSSLNSPLLPSSSQNDQEIQSIFTFSNSSTIPDEKTITANPTGFPNNNNQKSSASSIILSSSNSKSVVNFNNSSETFDPPFNSTINYGPNSSVHLPGPTLGFRSTTSPYENVIPNAKPTVYESNSSPPPRLRTRLGLPFPTSTSNATNVNNCTSHKPIDTNILRPILLPQPQQSYCSFQTQEDRTDSRSDSCGSRTPPNPKSKLSVSFANSVKEFGQDDSSNNEEDDLKEEDSGHYSSLKTIATQVQVHHDSGSKNSSECLDEHPPKICITSSKPEGEDVIKTKSQSSSSQSNPSQCGISSSDSMSASNPVSTCQIKEITYQITFDGEDKLSILKKEIRELEEQEMEAIRELELEKALLKGEEECLESQLSSDSEELAELKDRLSQTDESNSKWNADSLERIGELKIKLISSEKELGRLERMHEEFSGTTDEETHLLERLKFLHELVESDRKAFEDAEFHHMEEEINKESQRDELSKLVSELERKQLTKKFQLDKVRSQNTLSSTSSLKEIQSLESKRQEMISELKKTRREPSKQNTNVLSIPNSDGSLSDYEDTKNSDLEEKLRQLCILSGSPNRSDDALYIQRIKSRSPIDPHLGTIGSKTSETLREIERNREFLLNEQGVQMLEEERARVRELQKRVQEAVREEWEASRKTRQGNQCHSLNSVGSEDSGHTVSDTPTESGSGSGDGAPPSISTTDEGLHNSFQVQLCQQMRTREMSMSALEESRPLSNDSSVYDQNSIVTLRDKNHRGQNRPLTRYLPVRGGDEDEFDLRAHIESSGHQLELCPHVILTRSTARGFLSKLGSRFHNWNKRWFVFDRESRTLSYFADSKNEKKSKARGGIHFEAIEEVYVDHLQSVKSPMPKLTFCVKTYSRVFYLLAPSPEAMRMWIDIIFTGAEGYKEFKSGT